jgi:hypothetical protein
LLFNASVAVGLFIVISWMWKASMPDRGTIYSRSPLTTCHGSLSWIAAAEHGGAAAMEQVDQLMDKGRDLIDSAADLIRERPLASFGVAFAAGWIIAKLARSGGGDK